MVVKREGEGVVEKEGTLLGSRTWESVCVRLLRLSITGNMAIELRTKQHQEPPRRGSPTRSRSPRETPFERSSPPPEDGLMVTNEREAVSLPPMDGGKEAWLFLISCFMIECLVWGRLPGRVCLHVQATYSDSQRFHSPLASSRAITAPTSHSPAPVTSPSSAPARWYGRDYSPYPPPGPVS